MKIALIISFTILVLFTTSTVNANPYSDGLITGMLVEKVSPFNKKSQSIKYNNMIIDTELLVFPYQKAPICKPIKVKQNIYNKQSPIVSTLLSFIFMGILCNLSIDPDFNKFMIGYIIGGFL
jgi:hypothetical protein